MKTKWVLVIVTLILLVLAFLFFRKAIQIEAKTSPLIAYNFVKCAPAKFMLEDVDTTRQIAPLFKNLGNHTFNITTSNKEAQDFFNQGLRLAYAFNHAESHRSFMETSRLDPASAMGYWGQAYSLGPNINDPLPDDTRKKEAYMAVQKALKNISGTSPRENALINALSKRYNKDVSTDLAELNVQYMQAMKEVKDKFPEDAEILTIYADAIMNTMPWNYWDNSGNPLPNTLEAKLAIEEAIKSDPNHPGAHHLYIHLVELPKPDLAVASADILGSLMPGAGHIVHMPSHIYIRIGRYKDAVKANQDAILADEDYISQCFSQGMYPLGYYPHNIHFLWSASSLLGDSKTAIDAARKTAEKVPIGELKELPFLQDFASTPLLAYVRFGKWNDILTIPYPGDDFKHLKLIYHYARGIAFLRKNNLPEAEQELDALQELSKDPELESIIANYTNPSSKIIKVAVEVLSAEIANHQGNTSEAIGHLKKAIVFEDALIYSEPSPWHIPSRQTLGSIFLKDGKYIEAENIYKEDLAILRQNGWSLMGLYQSLKAQGKIEEANKIKQEYEKAWKYADVKINSSIL
jgi:tetratricopeptide (TPR) repeat protein